jgi:hypothetical protein
MDMVKVSEYGQYTLYKNTTMKFIEIVLRREGITENDRG